ncbi:hypothetical protein EJB05_26682 [Eragrostis curvula]|uniref:Uncharacterized protein n=1 Tax=Eragrostis curvula TaxID=38414 RepID=A0A5J9ULW4_9POAL|nr:hypothetical protein EJB05_26682 [Eragrostis curvula]
MAKTASSTQCPPPPACFTPAAFIIWLLGKANNGRAPIESRLRDERLDWSQFSFLSNRTKLLRGMNYSWTDRNHQTRIK